MTELLSSYFDGGNKANSAEYKVATLAVICGTHDVWVPFEKEWKKTLRKHDAKFLHTTDVVSGVNEFDRWSWERRQSFLTDSGKVLRRHITRPLEGRVEWKYGLYVFTVTVVLKDFLDFRKINPSVPHNVDQLLARQALTAALLWGAKVRIKDHIFHFDRGEPFRGCVLDIMRSRKARRDAEILKRIQQTPELDSRRYPALQAADLLAWCVSNKNNKEVHDWQRKLLKSPRDEEWRDASNLNQVDQVEQELWATWNIQKRGATK